MRDAYGRTVLGSIALAELGWALAFYFWPGWALGLLGRGVIDPVICRQYPLYLASAALAYALAATNPRRYRGIIVVCIVQRGVEAAAAALDFQKHAIGSAAFAWLAALEILASIALLRALSPAGRDERWEGALDRRDRGLVRLLRGFGGLEVFWFLASTIFVQLGSRLLDWKLADPYTTQQQGIGLLVIGLASLCAASNVARYRVIVWVPIASQLIGIANSFNEIRLGSIGWGVAATQWTIETTFVAAFVYFSRRSLRESDREALPSTVAIETG
jgi:hypothetical protein